MQLYKSLAHVYHIIYPHIFDYPSEFEFYHSVFEKFNCKNILELACGTGILAKYLIQANYSYAGLDLHEEMLAIAREENPTGHFLRGDMRYFKNSAKYDAILIAGKSLSHLLTNADILSCFNSAYAHLKPGGILVFDAYDANAEFGDWIDEGEEQVVADGATYLIQGKYTQLLDTGWTARWQLTYTLPSKEQITDTLDIRSFTADEIRLLLKLSQFEVKVVTNLSENVLICIGQKGS